MRPKSFLDLHFSETPKQFCKEIESLWATKPPQKDKKITSLEDKKIALGFKNVSRKIIKQND